MKKQPFRGAESEVDTVDSLCTVQLTILARSLEEATSLPDPASTSEREQEGGGGGCEEYH